MNIQTKTFTSKVIDLNSDGQGICSYDKLKVFVDQTIPDEEILAKIHLLKKNYGVADLIEVLSPSKERTTPICPIFGVCGGCQIMHMNYDAQLKYKQKKVQEALLRIGKIEIEVQPCQGSPSEFHYRNKIQLPFFTENNQLRLGLYQKRSHNPVAVERCYIHSNFGEKIYQQILKLVKDVSLKAFDQDPKNGLRHLLLRSSIATQSCLVVFIAASHAYKESITELGSKLMNSYPQVQGVILNVNTKRHNTITGDRWVTLCGKNMIKEEICGLSFRVSAHSFLQVNTLQAENLYTKAMEFASLSQHDRVLDAYCGVGTLSLIAATRARSVDGVELVDSAIHDAQINAKENNISNTSFYAEKVEDFIQRKNGCYDVIFLNPPRKGCERSVLDALIANPCKKIIYVSCDPATLSRDLEILTRKRYRLLEVQPFDMFPQTSHVETCVLLTLN